jgi:hypothetical protein
VTSDLMHAAPKYKGKRQALRPQVSRARQVLQPSLQAGPERMAQLQLPALRLAHPRLHYHRSALVLPVSERDSAVW